LLLKVKPSLFREFFLVFFFFFLWACESPLVLPSIGGGKELSFFIDRKAHDKDRAQVLKQSHSVYFGQELCLEEYSCRKICRQIFIVPSDEQECEKLPLPQVYQFQELSHHIFSEKFNTLYKINIFDLKVFLNLSPEPLYRHFQTLGPFLKTKFLIELAKNWHLAKVLSDEDWDFLFLDFFLKDSHLSPITVLAKEIFEGRTFVELAWLKQNDPALFWLDDYFKQVRCEKLDGEELESCSLAQYCSLSSSLPEDILKGWMSLKRLNLSLKKSLDLPQDNLKLFCSAFCLSEKGQNYCD